MTYENFIRLKQTAGNPILYESTIDGYNLTTYMGPIIAKCSILGAGHKVTGVESGLEVQRLADFDNNHKATAIDIS